MRCAVIGAGAWGTALADLLASNGHKTLIWAREPDVVADIERHHRNARFLAGAELSPELRATSELAAAVRGAELVLLAAPSEHLRGVARQAAPCIGSDVPLAIATKGIERETLALMSTVVEAELPGRPVAALSGPGFAAEVAARQPTAIVAASNDPAAARLVQEVFSSTTFRVYTNDDIVGVELGGSLKNVVAIATGIVEGVGLGHNSRAALITRGLHEMTRLGVALGARPLTLAGLAGIGDLVLTCTGALSRNRSLGVTIGQGATLEQALEGKDTVAEGVPTAASAAALAQRHGVDMPIVQMVNRILFERLPARLAVPELMARELRSEQDL